ncbi:trp operon leader peptide [Streptomyces sp. P1-3]
MGETTRPFGVARCAAGSGRVRGMFARLTMDWWWTAHPAAH